MAGRQSDDAWRRRLRAVVKRYWKKQWAVAEDAGVAQAGHLEAGTPGVCIEFEMPPEHELLSDFDLWHFVFGQETSTRRRKFARAGIEFLIWISARQTSRRHERRSGYKGQYGKCRLQPYVMFRRSHQRGPIWARPKCPRRGRSLVETPKPAYCEINTHKHLPLCRPSPGGSSRSPSL